MQNEDYEDVCRWQLPVLRSLVKMPTLRHLQIVLALDHDNTYKHWIRALEAMPHLESLSLKCEKSVNRWVIQRTVYLCHGLRCLSVRFMERLCSIQVRGRREHRDVKAAIETMPEMQLRELSFERPTMREENIFQPLLERCPRLEKLDLNWTHDGALLQHLVKTLKENKLPALRHLRMAVRNGAELHNLLIEVLSHIACGLESFDYGGDDGNLFAQPLIKHHSHSLTRLDLHRSWFQFRTFLDLMVGLPCLQTFTAMIFDGTSDGDNDIPLNRQWECLGLTSLQLNLNACIYYATYGNGRMESEEKLALDHVFSEIAKLTSLRELRIRRNWMDLYDKSRGYLEQLAGLKQLEILELTNTKHNTLGKHEAQWMADNWPRLRQIYEQHVPVAFKETLWKRRPLVEFVKDTSYN
ncbi:MAG: hypothetical protein J3Q66DRAFT_330932 [Benniella sp.]|nr:MAG: hypothetical protein J3Q66DRAFT_330932 [Benniella sp.]